MTEKTTEQLLEERNDLLRQQNKLLEQQTAEAHYVGVIAEREARARAWDNENPVGKYLWLNPHRR